MGIIFLQSGLFTTVQDLGRNGYQSSGFHVCGAMDQHAFKIANMLLDNKENAAVLEFTMMGPTICFTTDTVFAITGGNFSPTLNGKTVSMYQAVSATANDVLEFKFASDGNWGYVAFAGGLDVPKELGSRSTDTKCGLGGYHGRKIEKGDQIEFRPVQKYLYHLHTRKAEKPTYDADVTTIRVIMGPQDDYFTEQGIQTFLSSEYKLTSECDRMGYRLDGAYIEHNEKGADIISDGIALGSVQVPAHGKPIVMLADRQTTGGYTKIATVVSVDIPKLVQCKFNKKVRFEAISIEEAQSIYLEERKAYEILYKQIRKSSGRLAALKDKLTAIFKK